MDEVNATLQMNLGRVDELNGEIQKCSHKKNLIE